MLSSERQNNAISVILISSSLNSSIEQIANSLIQLSHHCVNPLLPSSHPPYTRYSLRSRGHKFSLPQLNTVLYRNMLINQCLFQYICLQCFDAGWLSVWSEMQTCIWPSWCHCHSLSLASVKSRLVFPFWYRLTWVVPDKGPLNGLCVCVCVLYERCRCHLLFIKSYLTLTSHYYRPQQLHMGRCQFPAVFCNLY